MRLLGMKASLSLFRHDLVFLLASLASDHRDPVKALAPPVAQLLTELRSERELFEQAEDAALIMSARKGRRDDALDAVLVQMGGVARAIDKALYATLFANHNPTQTARMALADEVVEAERIAGELAGLPEAHPIRTEYAAGIGAALDGVRDAIKTSSEADTALALARSRLDRFKVRADQLRVTTHGKLQALLQNKVEADEFFRKSTSSPGGADEAPAPVAPEKPVAPA